MLMRARMSLIMGQIEPEHPELFALEFGKIAESDFLYTLVSTNINQSTPNLVKMYMTLRSRMSLIMDLIGPELSTLASTNNGQSTPKLFALEFGKSAESDFVYTPASTNIDQSASNLVKMYMTIKSQMSLILGQIKSEHPELSALEFEHFPYLTLFTLLHLQILSNQYQTWPQCICP